MFHTRFNLHVAITRRPNGRSLCDFVKAIIFRISGIIVLESTFRFASLKCEVSHRPINVIIFEERFVKNTERYGRCHVCDNTVAFGLCY
jgi:hypothetical protein